MQNESRKALHELLDTLRDVDERYLGPEYLIESSEDVADGVRAIAHMLEGGLASYFEQHESHPTFRRIVSPSRKFTGDNADAVYYDAPIDPARSYVVRGNLAGAIYTSFTLEVGSRDGQMGTRTAGVLNDEEFQADADGNYEIHLGGEKRDGAWLPLDPETSRVTTRHYYEEAHPVAADATHHIPLSIERLGEAPPPPSPDDASVAAGIRRVTRFVQSRTLGMPPPGERELPPFVSRNPNQFPQPVKPGDFGLAAFDAAYSQAPFLLGPEDALVITGRWPACRCANVSLWNRHLQTFDYANRSASLNRKQTVLEPDGSFRIVIAHRDPGVPNWLDTEGRAFGMVFWRFMLPEGEIAKPEAERVSFAEVAR
ncbi:MAG: hypothetical protein CL910_17655 [Deltaproteobacteria bacterium]|nr:hypothetical protein [Deltaproteobacteria bacterium]